jgi:hypothetical protein
MWWLDFKRVAGNMMTPLLASFIGGSKAARLQKSGASDP